MGGSVDDRKSGGKAMTLQEQYKQETGNSVSGYSNNKG
jgi:hypothetical protein